MHAPAASRAVRPRQGQDRARRISTVHGKPCMCADAAWEGGGEGKETDASLNSSLSCLSCSLRSLSSRISGTTARRTYRRRSRTIRLQSSVPSRKSGTSAAARHASSTGRMAATGRTMRMMPPPPFPHQRHPPARPCSSHKACDARCLRLPLLQPPQTAKSGQPPRRPVFEHLAAAAPPRRRPVRAVHGAARASLEWSPLNAISFVTAARTACTRIASNRNSANCSIINKYRPKNINVRIFKIFAFSTFFFIATENGEMP